MATQFTSPGAHVVSVYDLLRQAKRRPTLIADALKKARALLEHLQKFVAVRASNWLIEALKAYALEQPTLPVVGPTNCKDGLSIVLTMDPSFAFSVSRMVSDGWLTRGRNYSLHHPEYAPLFARIGASRALRAQRVGGGLVNYYMPLIEAEVELTPETAWPILPGVSVSSKQAVILYLFNLLRGENHPKLQIDKFSYQLLQPQGHHQSISIGYGAFSTGRMKQLQERLGPGLMDGWRMLCFSVRSRVERPLTSTSWLNSAKPSR